MPKGVIDLDGLNAPENLAIRNQRAAEEPPFSVTKLGHAVLMVSDIEKSVDFYVNVLGFRVSDVYPDTMMKGRMVFMRFNADHHGVALVGGAPEDMTNNELHHMAFQVETIDEVFRARDHLERHGVNVDFHGRRRAGAQVAVEFSDPDGHGLEIYWGLDQMDWDGEPRPPEEWSEQFSLEDAVDNPPPGQDTTLADPSLRRSS